MPFQPVVDDVYMLPQGGVNVFLITADAPVLIDAGYASSPPAILEGLAGLGYGPRDLKHILLTHCHPDHAGGLVDVQAATGATVINHALDAAVLNGSQPWEALAAAPGLLNRVMFNLFIKPNLGAAKPFYRTRQHVADGETLPLAGGITAWHTPGHSAGHVVFQWRDVLFLGDAAFNLVGLGEPIGYADQATGRKSLQRIAGLDFETAVFGHGKPIIGGAAAQFRGKWGPAG